MKPELLERIVEMRRRAASAQEMGKTIGFVPTMGALHAGHGALMDAAVRDNGLVVVSIFVNPTQFNKKDDYRQYARDLGHDLEFCERHGVDLVFAPDVNEMYPAGDSVSVEVAGVSEGLCGAFRPGHFRGVATVVTKLFHIVQPDVAYFGEKDAQQLAVIRKLVSGLDMPVSIVGVPTVREADGLALSSRNQRLAAGERRVAPGLFRALSAARERILDGVTDAAEVKAAGTAVLAREPAMKVEYFEVVDPEHMQVVTRIRGPVCVAAAVWLGSVRLIDNVMVY